MTEGDLGERTSRYLKAELKREGVTYDELAERLTRLGLQESKATIANKLSRGAFSATFMVAALKAIGRENVSLSDI